MGTSKWSSPSQFSQCANRFTQLKSILWQMVGPLIQQQSHVKDELEGEEPPPCMFFLKSLNWQMVNRCTPSIRGHPGHGKKASVSHLIRGFDGEHPLERKSEAIPVGRKQRLEAESKPSDVQATQVVANSIGAGHTSRSSGRTDGRLSGLTGGRGG